MTANHAALAMPEPWNSTGVFLGRASLPLFAAIIGLRLMAGPPDRARRYLLRLVTWGVLAQPVYQLLLSHLPAMRLNALFTLAAGVALVYLSAEGLLVMAMIVAGLLITGDAWLDGGAWMPVSLWLAWLWNRHCPDIPAVPPLILASAAAGMVFFHNHLTLGHMIFAGLAPLVMINVSPMLSSALPRLPGFVFYAYYPLHLGLIYLIHGPY